VSRLRAVAYRADEGDGFALVEIRKGTLEHHRAVADSGDRTP